MLLFVYGLLLLNFTQFCNSDIALGKVVFASVLYGNGDRTPLEPYPNDPYKNESSWPVPFGQLTPLGIRQHLALGRWLRDRYAHLFSSKYSKHEIFVSSIDANITRMSAKANLAGMFPRTRAEMFGVKKWSPIPIHSVPDLEDNVLAAKKFCERYSRGLKRVLSFSEIREIEERSAELYDYLSEMTGKKISSLRDAGLLYDTLFIQELYNKTLPVWTRSVYPSRLKFLAEKNFQIPAYSKTLKTLKSGPLLKEIIEHMQSKSTDTLTPNKKLWIYSTFDHTIANLLMTLGLFEPHCPPSAATLMIELRVNAQSDHVVTIFYKNTTEQLTLLTLPGCVAACPLNDFISLTKDVIPGNWELECSFEYEDKLRYEAHRKDWLLAVGIILCAVMFAVLIVMVLPILILLDIGKSESNNNKNQ